MRKQLIVGAVIATFAGIAAAQTTPSTPPSSAAPSAAPSGDVFTKLDADKDGMVSKKEASKNKDLTSKWDTLDTNKDGKLDQGEFAAFETSGTTTPKY
jgi:EF hand domain-containing protein